MILHLNSTNDDNDGDANVSSSSSSSNGKNFRGTNLRINPLLGRQIYYDALMGSCTNFNLPPPDPQCCLCGENPSILTIDNSRGI